MINRQMLSKIKLIIEQISSEPSISFEEYYNRYILTIQDYCLELEAKYRLRGKSLKDQYAILDNSLREVLHQ